MRNIVHLLLVLATVLPASAISGRFEVSYPGGCGELFVEIFMTGPYYNGRVSYGTIPAYGGTHGWDFNSGNINTIYAKATSYGSGIDTANSAATNFNGTLTLPYSCTLGWATAPTPSYYKQTVKNDWPIPRTFEFWLDGELYDTVTLQPGEETFFELTDSSGAEHDIRVQMSPISGSLFEIEPNQFTNFVGMGQSLTGATLTIAPQQPKIPTNNPIQFSNPSDANTINREGFGAVAAATQTGNELQIAKLDEISKLIAKLPTNSPTAGSSTNFVTVSNLINITNSLTVTNDNAALTNFLAERFKTNRSELTNRWDAGVLASGSNAASGAFNNLQGQVGGLLNVPTMPIGSPSALEITIPGVGIASLNPLNYAPVAAVAPWLRSLAAFSMIVGTFIWMLTEIAQYIRAFAAAQQARPAGESILGTNLNIGEAVIAAGIIVAVLGGFILAVGALIGTFVAQYASEMSGVASGGGVVSEALGFLDAVFPIGLSVGLFVGKGVFSLTIAGLFTVAQAVIRFAVPCIAVGLLWWTLEGGAQAQTNTNYWGPTNSVIIGDEDYTYSETGSVWGAAFWGFASAFGLGVGVSAVRYFRQGLDV